MGLRQLWRHILAAALLAFAIGRLTAAEAAAEAPQAVAAAAESSAGHPTEASHEAAAGAGHEASGEHGAAHHKLTLAPVDVGHIGPLPISNSMVITWVVALLLIVFARMATRRLEAVPSGAQNFWEWLVESLHGFLESVLGGELTRKTFWFFATIFLFIMAVNWAGLIPGVGTVGMGVQTEHGFVVTDPILRGGNADLNMTFAMAMLFFLFWTIWALQVNGVKGFLLHIFGPKGDMKGVLKLFMMVIFFAVGFIEVISILFRPVSLSFRLFGNVFAGENMLESMSRLIQEPAWLKAVASVVIPIPFYFLELLVGIVQAMVFMLLTAVFTLLICLHDEEHEGAAH